MSWILNDNSFKGQLLVLSGFGLSARSTGVIYFPLSDLKEKHSEPAVWAEQRSKCSTLIFALWGSERPLQDKEINRSVDSGRHRQHSLLSASCRIGCSVCAGKPARRIRVSRIGSDRFSVNWLSLLGFLPLTPFSALLRGMRGCWKGDRGREGAELVKGSTMLAWQLICIYFWLPLEKNHCGSCPVQSSIHSRTNLAAPFCTLLSCNLGFLSWYCDGSFSEREMQRLLWLR